MSARGSPVQDYERCASNDPLHDYVLERYEPRVPHAGKLRSVNLLYQSFAAAGLEAEGRRVVTTIRDALGPFRTIWGVKHDQASGEVRGWELYFYDWKRAHADLTLQRVREALADVIVVDATEPRALPWHMFSIEFDLEALRQGAAFRPGVPAHVYIDMRSYALRGTALSFENIYTFHDPRVEIDDVLARVRASVHYDLSREALQRLLPPELFACHRMCVANKRDGDAFYFSRVPTKALLCFLLERGYPSSLSELVERELAELEHLLWDVGLDFTATPQGALIRRSGFYGSF